MAPIKDSLANPSLYAITPVPTSVVIIEDAAEIFRILPQPLSTIIKSPFFKKAIDKGALSCADVAGRPSPHEEVGSTHGSPSPAMVPMVPSFRSTRIVLWRLSAIKMSPSGVARRPAGEPSDV